VPPLRKREGHGPSRECKSQILSPGIYSNILLRKFLNSELNKKEPATNARDHGLLSDSEDEDDDDP